MADLADVIRGLSKDVSRPAIFVDDGEYPEFITNGPMMDRPARLVRLGRSADGCWVLLKDWFEPIEDEI